MVTYGYIRKRFPISETDQIVQIMAYKCEELFFESQSLLETTELEIMLDKLASEDTVVVASLQVFGKSVQKLQPIIEIFKNKKIRLICLDNNLDTKRDSFFYSSFNYLYQMDINCESEKIKQKIILARDEGKIMGRPSLDEETTERIYKLYHDYKWTMRRIANECEVSLGSVSKYTQREESQNETSTANS